MIQPDTTDREPTQQTLDSASDRAGAGAKRAYHSPRLSDLGPIVQATLGPTPDGQESGTGGANYRIR